MEDERDDTDGGSSGQMDIIAVLRPTVASQRVSIDGAKWTVFHEETQSKLVYLDYDKIICEDDNKRPSSDSEENRTRRTPLGKQRQVIDTPEDTEGAVIPVHLDRRTKSGRGFICGRDKRVADLIIPQTFDSVSKEHFSITFDEEYRLIVKDLCSGSGTNVLYDGVSTGPRIDSHWIIGGLASLQGTKTVTIEIPHNIKFEVEVKPFSSESMDFRLKVDRFLQPGNVHQNRRRVFEGQDSLLRQVFLAGTTKPIGGSSMISRQLGTRGIVTVNLVTDVQDGRTWIEKRSDLDPDRKWRDREVEREAQLLCQISHENIVKFLGYRITPQPTLTIEYIPGGTLRSHLSKHSYFTLAETVAIAQQTTSALAFIHGLDPKIAHCNLNADNIYVQQRNDIRISVKLAGFEMAQQGSDWMERTESDTYHSLETSRSNSMDNNSFAEAMDIWSLGVVLVEISLSLPTLPKRCTDLQWYHRVVDHLKETGKGHDQAFQKFLLSNMLQIKPKDRCSAQQCHDNLIQFGAMRDDIGPSDDGAASKAMAMALRKDYDRDSGYTSASRSILQRTTLSPVGPSRSLVSDTDISQIQQQQSENFEHIPSDDDEIGSQVSHETNRQERDGKALIMLFLADDYYIGDFCKRAITELTEQQFVDTMRRLLKTFHQGLMKEAVSEAQKTTAKLLRSRRGRLRISRNLIEHFRDTQDDLQDKEHSRPEPSQEEKIGVEAWLAQVSTVNEVNESRSGALEADAEAVAALSDDSTSEDEFPHITDLKGFLRDSVSLCKLQRNALLSLLPYTLRRILSSAPSESVWLSQEQDVSLSNRFKAWVEDSTELKWNWRPFERRKRQLKDNESRVFWRCTCGFKRWEEISSEQHDIISNVLEILSKLVSDQNFPSEARKSRFTMLRNSIWSIFRSPETAAAPSTAAQRYTPQQRPKSEAQPLKSPQSNNSTIKSIIQRCRQSGSAIATGAQPTAPSTSCTKIESWILFGVKGSRRTLNLAQIPINSNMTDYEAFQALKGCYKKHRGRLRMWFSIWSLDNCEVVKFSKLTQDRLLRERPDLPSHQEYIYSPRAGSRDAMNPPVPQDAFDALVYTCKPSCAWILPHDCFNPSSSAAYIERVPKRERDFMNDHGSPIWGFAAVYSVCWLRVALYHVIMVFGPLVFWLCWLKVHPGDWQNAAVPITVVLGSLSLFWSAAGILTTKIPGKVS